MLTLTLTVIVAGVLALVALSTARGNDRRVGELQQQLAQLTMELRALRHGLAAPQVPLTAEPVVATPPTEAVSETAAAAHVAEEPTPVTEPVLASGSPSGVGALEDKLTSRWLVWLGAVAIALGGAFFVKYAIDNELLGPAARVTLGVILGIALAAAGEWLRRSPLQQAIAAIRPNHVPPALTASGISVAFASLYAAYALHGLIGPLIAFLALGAVALAAVGLSILQGPFVALLGLLCAFLTPALIETPHPSAWGLFGYLLIVEGACLAVVRYRGWWWLAFATLAGTAIWPFLWLLGAHWSVADVVPLGTYLILSALAFFFVRAGMKEPKSRDALLDELRSLELPERAVLSAGCVIAALLFVMAAAADYNTTALVLFGLAMALYLGMGRYDRTLEGLPIVGAIVTLLVIATMPLPHGIAPPSPIQMYGPLVPHELSRYATTNLVFVFLFGIGGFIALWGARRPGIWAGVSAALPVSLLAVAYWRVVEFGVDLEWAGLALALAAACLLAAERVERYCTVRGLDVSLGLYAAGVVAFVSLAFAMSLKQAWLTVALSIQLPALGWIRRRVPVRALDVLAGIIAAIVLVRLVFNYNVLHYPVAATPLFHWVLYGYGLPAVSFFAASRLFRQAQETRLVTLLQAGALAFAVLLVSLEIRLLVTGSLATENYDLFEQSLQSLSWLAVGAGLAGLETRGGSKVAYYGARVLIGLAAAQIVFLELLLDNPLESGDSVGGVPFVDGLLLAYLMPALFALWLSEMLRKRAVYPWAEIASAAGFTLLFVYLTFEVRRLFQGPVLAGAAPSDAEIYTYSVMWLVYAVALLGAGIALQRSVERYASLVVLALTSLKVFLYDMDGLTGLYRAASFLGLGLSLVGIGYLYQRLVVTRPTASAGTG